ncbi:MAG: UDP-N-acetylmuramoyl-L-alanyl-D-glutamate--2,6-diaminopimelate ligase [Desulfovibrionaceae bacterium]|nr:UDP-N-acetylmuramoyl-L-alanyl-D-glutamate--2,6-diaminopimelate ligase [Desulfovibrionaceae bacterium]
MRMAYADVIALLAEGRCSVQVDSRKIAPGDVFVAVTGENEDGARYIPQAIERGARYIVLPSDREIALPETIGVCPVSDTREAVAELARARFHTGERKIKILGITGTNGKTTCAALLEHLLRACGHTVGVLGTVTYRWPGHLEAAPLTTPGPLQLHEMLAAMDEAGCDYCVMEVSSHALAQKRVAGLSFSGAALTNLTQDHLDFHGTMENYFAAKAKLFCELPDKKKAMAINCDDPYGRRLLALCPDALPYGLSAGSCERLPRLSAELIENDIHGLRLRMHYMGQSTGTESWDLHSPLLGAFNAANLLTVQALALGLGFQSSDLAVLSSFTGVCGRLERVPCGGKHVFVDYAHTPDALVNVLKAIRDAGFTRIITVFGCGGNRDRTKRPRMGEAVAKNSDIAIVTSDNPRFEDPMSIIQDILPGMKDAKEYSVQPDRRKATEQALALATDARDCVLIAGKGHEDYQIIQGERRHYSDQEVVRAYAKAKG